MNQKDGLKPFQTKKNFGEKRLIRKGLALKRQKGNYRRCAVVIEAPVIILQHFSRNNFFKKAGKL